MPLDSLLLFCWRFRLNGALLKFKLISDVASLLFSSSVSLLCKGELLLRFELTADVKSIDCGAFSIDGVSGGGGYVIDRYEYDRQLQVIILCNCGTR